MTVAGRILQARSVAGSVILRHARSRLNDSDLRSLAHQVVLLSSGPPTGSQPGLRGRCHVNSCRAC